MNRNNRLFLEDIEAELEEEDKTVFLHILFLLRLQAPPVIQKCLITAKLLRRRLKKIRNIKVRINVSQRCYCIS